MPRGGMLVVSMKDRKILRMEPDGQVVEHADLWDYCGGHANDMVVAPNGNAYVGNFGFDLMGGAPYEPADIVLVSPGCKPEKVATVLLFTYVMVIIIV